MENCTRRAVIRVDRQSHKGLGGRDEIRPAGLGQPRCQAIGRKRILRAYVHIPVGNRGHGKLYCPSRSVGVPWSVGTVVELILKIRRVIGIKDRATRRVRAPRLVTTVVEGPHDAVASAVRRH